MKGLLYPTTPLSFGHAVPETSPPPGLVALKMRPLARHEQIIPVPHRIQLRLRVIVDRCLSTMTAQLRLNGELAAPTAVYAPLNPQAPLAIERIRCMATPAAAYQVKEGDLWRPLITRDGALWCGERFIPLGPEGLVYTKPFFTQPPGHICLNSWTEEGTYRAEGLPAHRQPAYGFGGVLAATRNLLSASQGYFCLETDEEETHITYLSQRDVFARPARGEIPLHPMEEISTEQSATLLEAFTQGYAQMTMTGLLPSSGRPPKTYTYVSQKVKAVNEDGTLLDVIFGRHEGDRR